nr:hypothetical protein [Brevibacillus sp. BC25]
MADATDVVVVVAVAALAPAAVAVAVAVPAPAVALALAVALASSHALSWLMTIYNPYVNEAPAPNCVLAGALFFQLECETKSDT